MEVGSESYSKGIEGTHVIYELNKWYHISCRFAGSKNYIELIKNSTYWAENGSFLYRNYNTQDSITTLRISGNRGIQIDDIKISYATGKRKDYFDIYNDRGKIISVSDSTNGIPLAPGTFVFPENVLLDKTTSNLLKENEFTDTVYATVSPENTFNKSIQWESGDTAIMHILESNNEMATICGKSTGATTITAYTEEGSLSAVCQVNVTRPMYQIKITSNNGQVSLDPESGLYDEGTEVVLEAFPNNGYIFSEWIGDVSDTNNPIILVMDSDVNITAVFTLNTSFKSTEYEYINIYPNPLESEIHELRITGIKSASSLVLRIYSMQGEQLINQELSTSQRIEGNCKIDIKNLKPGMYFLKLSGNKIDVSKKLIIH